MKKEKLMDAIGEIDEKLIDSADMARGRKKTKKIRWQKILIAAACVALAAAMVVTLALNFGGGAKKGADAGVTDTEAPLDSEFSMKVRKGSEDVNFEEAVRGDVDFFGSVDDSKAGVSYEVKTSEGDLTVFPSTPAELSEGGDIEGGEDGYGGGVIGYDPSTAAAFVLTASEWRDNDNWPFFTNLVNSEIISFPSYGVDPRNRIRVEVKDGEGNLVEGEAVTLYGDDGKAVWTARSDKDGVAYLFWKDGETPASAEAGETRVDVHVAGEPGEQGASLSKIAEDLTITVDGGSREMTALQVMFILDTTGSMGDELAYLQMDFSAIAEDVGADGVYYSVNFYRDEGDDYVTKCSNFTSDVSAIKDALMNETCDGGGDMPEAVAQVLTDTVTDNENWRDDCRKIAFLIFDAPPHEGVDEEIDAAVRSAAARGIKLIPVVASGTDRDTELFGRAIAITTGGTYVFITDDSGVGGEHLDPIIGDHTVELLHDVIVRIINENKVG